MLNALHTYQGNQVTAETLAQQACAIEIDRLRKPIGKQDQYIAAFGGLTCFRFLTDGRVEARPLRLDPDTLHALEDNLLLFFTGYSRSASEILREQDQKSRATDAGMTSNLHLVKQLGLDSCTALEGGDLERFAELMNAHWQWKKKRSGAMTNPIIDRWYDLALRYSPTPP